MGSPYLMYDGARISRESTLGKELEKWERRPDWRPENNVYPRMLYRASKRPDGKRSVHELNDALFPVQGEKGPVVVSGSAEQWSRRNQKTVNSEDEYRLAYGLGWRPSPQEALDVLDAEDAEVFKVTAERHASDARMSEKAQAEAAAADQSTLKQLPTIPEKKTDRMAAARAAKAAKKAGGDTAPAA
jgi:hypothetical protein